MQDQYIKCIGVNNDMPCPYNTTFTHSVKDQEFYQAQGFEAPKRCRDCREAKKALKTQVGYQKPRYDGHKKNKAYRGSRHEDQEWEDDGKY